MSSFQESASAEFHAFEHAGWQSASREYDDAFGRLTCQVIGPLLDAVGVGKGMRVLDVASGPGYVAAEAAAREGAERFAADGGVQIPMPAVLAAAVKPGK